MAQLQAAPHIKYSPESWEIPHQREPALWHLLQCSRVEVELIKIDSNGKRIFEIVFNGKKLMKSISMDFQWIFDTLPREALKEVELILNMRNGLQFNFWNLFNKCFPSSLPRSPSSIKLKCRPSWIKYYWEVSGAPIKKSRVWILELRLFHVTCGGRLG